MTFCHNTRHILIKALFFRFFLLKTFGFLLSVLSQLFVKKSKLVFFTSSIWRTLLFFLLDLDLQENWFTVLLLNQSQELFVYSIFWNNFILANNQFCIHLFKQIQSFKCFHMLCNHFYLLIKICFFINHKFKVFCFCSGKKLSFVTSLMFIVLKKSSYS